MGTTPRKKFRGRFWALSAVLAVGVLGAAAPASAIVSTVGGGATGVVATGPVSVGPIAQVVLPAAGGGPFTANAASVTSSVITAGAVNTSTQGLIGAGGFATSSASVASVLVPTIATADLVVSSCTSNESGSTGATTLTNATVAGVAVTATAPNTTIDIPGVATVVVNEQLVVNMNGFTSITVNALHITTVLGESIIIAQSMCQVAGDTVGSNLAVQLRSFRATPSKKGVLLRWKTASEVDTLGFNIYRQQGAKRTKVNRSLISSANASTGHSYSFLDRSLKKKQRSAKVRYWLQEVELDGSRSWLAATRPFAA
ncbi:MAG: hypothetical protein H0U03_06195 [Actinobacteria bacterium]|nr:hypothetical protein [Actinomycetota bacterium]